MFSKFEKFGNRLNGHVFKREHALEALRAGIVSESISLHGSYSPLLVEHQMKSDYKACFKELFAVACGNVGMGAIIANYETGWVQFFGLAFMGLGSYIALKMLLTYPTNDANDKPILVRADSPTANSVSA